MGVQVLRPYSAGDEQAIIRLASVVYPGLSLDLAGWNWRYKDNPAGQAIIELAQVDDEVVAHYAVSPVVVCADGSDKLTHLSLLTMTHPDWRGHRLFPQLAERAYRRAGLGGSEVIWGFPNRNSHRGFVNYLDWEDVYEIPMLRLALTGYNTFDLSPNVTEVLGFDERVDELWQRVRSRCRYMVKRDATYLQWRYVQNPTEHYRILVYTGSAGGDVLGYVVFKRYRSECQVVDLLAQNVHVGSLLIQSVTRLISDDATPPDSLSLWLNVTDPLHHALEKSGFRNEGPVTYFGIRFFQGCGWMLDFHDWHIAMGDSDVF